jgi:ubiquinone/menaquinone biosynthesis C-methylase UbiE
MPDFYNGYIHVIQRAALRRWLRVAPGTKVLEVGCGIGRWSRSLAGSGAIVTGIDLAPAMVAEARRRATAAGVAERCEFVEGDVAEMRFGRRFEQILCVTVLQHILDNERMQEALNRMAEHLAPNGRVVLLEAAPSVRDARCDTPTFTARSEAVWREAFARANLHCSVVRGVDPLPFKTRFMPYYRRLPRPLALGLLAVITGVALPCDLVLARALSRQSWHKLFVLRRV